MFKIIENPLAKVKQWYVKQLWVFLLGIKLLIRRFVNLNKDWFLSQHFPTKRFQSETFRHPKYPAV